jgi:cell division protein FtsQ
VGAQRRSSQRRAVQRRSAPRARTAVAGLPRAPRVVRVVPARFLPSRRSLAAGLALLVLAAGAYVAARETPTFAVGRIEVAGGPPAVRAQVRHELAPLLGTSLLGLDGAKLVRRVEALPTVVSAEYDRSFPHTLRLTVVAETPVAILHRGTETWLLSGRGRIIERVPPRTYPLLPRIWVTTATPVAVGAFVAPETSGAAARALALGSKFPAQVATAAMSHGELTFTLHSGLEVRLGAPTDVRLKLAVAWRALRLLPAGTTYLDVSVPGRPVAGGNPQVSSRG